jgi:hypothetical protein
MTDLSQSITKLGLFETLPIVPLQTFNPGTYTQKLLTEGNSLLSSLFVKTMDVGATVQVNYYDYGVGADDGERFNLTSHTLITSPTVPSPDRILVTRLHNKPVIEVVVSNGNAELGVYLTVVASFASDLDSALVKDAQDANLLVNKGIPIVTYDSNAGKFYILRSDAGVIPVAFSEAGDSVHLSTSVPTTPGSEQLLVDDTVPSGKTRKATQAIVVCRSQGLFTVESDGAIIGSGRTGPASPTGIFSWNPRKDIPAGKDVKIRFTANLQAPISNVEAYFMASDVTP